MVILSVVLLFECPKKDKANLVKLTAAFVNYVQCPVKIDKYKLLTCQGHKSMSQSIFMGIVHDFFG